MINWVQCLGGTTLLKFERAQNVQKSAWFRKTVDVERKYLWNGWRYQLAVNSINENDLSGVEQKKFVCGTLVDPPRLSRQCTFCVC